MILLIGAISLFCLVLAVEDMWLGFIALCATLISMGFLYIRTKGNGRKRKKGAHYNKNFVNSVSSFIRAYHSLCLAYRTTGEIYLTAKEKIGTGITAELRMVLYTVDSVSASEFFGFIREYSEKLTGTPHTPREALVWEEKLEKDISAIFKTRNVSSAFHDINNYEFTKDELIVVTDIPFGETYGRKWLYALDKIREYAEDECALQIRESSHVIVFKNENIDKSRI